MSQPQAFDALAHIYDDSFTRTQIGQYLRDIIHKRLIINFTSGDHILELGCGTGEDAYRLAELGIKMTATDVSQGMLALAQEKCRHQSLVEVQRLDLRHLPDNFAAFQTFDGVFSNFGPLNCLAEWKTLASWLAQRVKPNAVVGLGIMSPYCIWEPFWHGLHGNFRTATRRWHKSATFQVDPTSEPIRIAYPTIAHVTRDFAPYFQRTFVRGVGIFLPPSDVYCAIEKRPRLYSLLMGLERQLGQLPQLALLADHYWIEFQRK